MEEKDMRDMSDTGKEAGEEKFILGIDPGTYKVGLAVVKTTNRGLYFRRIVTLSELLRVVEMLVEEFMPELLILGDGTGHKFILQLLRRKFPWGPKIVLFPERNTTLRARQLYISQARGFIDTVIRFFKSFFIDVDDLAAYLIALDYLEGELDPKRYNVKRKGS